MGAKDAPHLEDGEGPVRPVSVSRFSIRKTTVTNATFADFVSATGHVTCAEQRGFSQVFQGQLAAPDVYAIASPTTPWWRVVEGACWRYPSGSAEAEPDMPAVHVSHADARAFCAWAGTRLPTEAEWECAAQDTDLTDINIWRGRFPDQSIAEIGPWIAASGSPNSNGLNHICGNVWEWTSDRFTNLHSPRPVTNPTGPLNGPDRVVKGGSFLCCPSYCARFRPSSRRSEDSTTTTSHLGFRDVLLG